MRKPFLLDLPSINDENVMNAIAMKNEPLLITKSYHT